MIALLLALATGPAVQEAAAPPPALVQAGDLTVGGGHMMAWSTGAGLGGEVAVIVRNNGSTPDRVVWVSTPAGPVGAIIIQVARDGAPVRLEDGDRTIAGADASGPGLSRISAELTGLSSGSPQPYATTITVRFERAGEVTIVARPASPAPPPAPAA